MFDHPCQYILRRGSSRSHRICITSIVVIVTHDGRPARSSHSHIYAASTTRPACPPVGLAVPPSDVNSQSIPVVSDKIQRSNIVAISASPGISRTDVIAHLLAANSSRDSDAVSDMLLGIRKRD